MPRSHKGLGRSVLAKHLSTIARPLSCCIAAHEVLRSELVVCAVSEKHTSQKLTGTCSYVLQGHAFAVLLLLLAAVPESDCRSGHCTTCNFCCSAVTHHYMVVVLVMDI